ncbi:MAG: MotA/TolQ/ExbB proton channel family protein [Elusimicrobia bacterium]|nr:MotA/TolQ/ExbB proton channel family protein [Elusimicrobiota bacterium]
MFEGQGALALLRMGGVTIYVLLFISVISFTIMLYKGLEFWLKKRVNRKAFLADILGKLKRGDSNAAINLCERTNSPMAPVIKAGIEARFENRPDIGEAMSREIAIEATSLEKFTTVLGSIGSVSVYIGLLGTVFGIMRAFDAMSASGSGDVAVVIAGVAEALITTAAGLVVAIPAIVAFNLFVKTIDKFVTDMEYCASAIEEFSHNFKREQYQNNETP